MDPRWRRLRLLHRLAFGLWLGWLPVVVVMTLQNARLRPPSAIVLALGYMVAFLVTNWIFSSLACPNCGRTFAFGSRSRRFVPWAPRCVHCDARIGAPIAGSEGHGPQTGLPN